MKAGLLYGIKDLRVEEIDIPDIGRGEVLARVKAATTCGTDIKIYLRGYVGKIIEYPMVFGHEWAGEIVEVGEGVEGLEKGMRIRAGNTSPCYRCEMCKRGKFNLCENRTWLWGAYAEYIRVPENIVRHNLQEIPPYLSYEEAAITEPLACVIHGAKSIGIGIGDSVAIIGSGPIGLMFVQVAKRNGARKVMIIDPVDKRLEKAEKLGADIVINPSSENPIERVKKETGGYGADVVIEAVGSSQTWMQALKMVCKGGRVLEFGGAPPGTKIEVETELLHYSEITLMGTFHATPQEFALALKLIADGVINVRELITRRMPLTELNKAFKILTTSKEDIKIAIIP